MECWRERGDDERGIAIYKSYFITEASVREFFYQTDNAHRVYYETINVRYTLVQSTGFRARVSFVTFSRVSTSTTEKFSTKAVSPLLNYSSLQRPKSRRYRIF